MKLIKVSKELEEYKDIKNLYKQAFPRNERAPFGLLFRKARSSAADFWALYDGEKWVGIAYVVTHCRLAYIFYLAIKENERNRGYGKKAIETLKRRYKEYNVFLALETLDEKNAPNYDQRVRRHAFYLRCGLSDLPYKLKEASVMYDLMGTGEPVEPEDYSSMMNAFFGRFFRSLIGMRIVKQKPEQ